VSDQPDPDRTRIIRRAPSQPLPEVPVPDAPTSLVPAPTPGPAAGPSPNGAIAAAVAAICSGWATAVIATDLITGWWATDRLFCVAVGFLAAVSSAALICGLIAVLLRRRPGRLLIVVGAVVALLIFASLFVAGARLPRAVYAIPALPLLTIALTALPATGRWARPG